jgi:transposase
MGTAMSTRSPRRRIRVDPVQAVLERLAEAQVETQAELRSLTGAVRQLVENVRALTGEVRGLKDRVGNLVGRDLERY